jgi:ferritin-like metal-binding protein YciE
MLERIGSGQIDELREHEPAKASGALTNAEAYRVALRRQHSVEYYAIEFFGQVAKQRHAIPESAEGAGRHLGLSMEQARRLRALMADIGVRNSVLMDCCMAIRGFLSGIACFGGVEKFLEKSLSLEQQKIVAYQKLLKRAHVEAHRAGIAFLGSSLMEEQVIDRWMKQHLRERHGAMLPDHHTLDRDVRGDKTSLHSGHRRQHR